VITAHGGDCLARAEVRIGELKATIRLARKLIDGLPEGPINGWKPVKMATQAKIPAGQAYVAIESPRGAVGTYAVCAPPGTSPYRLKLRSPSLHALSCLPYILPGEMVSDAVAILGSVDPIMGEVDR
jgi:NADH-quinone oxidoreductase subunit D